MSREAKVVQDPDAPVDQEVLAQAIVNISSSFKKLLKSGLNRRAVIALVANDTGLGRGTIGCVLDSIENLAKNYTR